MDDVIINKDDKDYSRAKYLIKSVLSGNHVVYANDAGEAIDILADRKSACRERV